MKKKLVNKIFLHILAMNSKLKKIGLTILGLSLVGIIVGLALVLLMSCVNISKWIFLKVWGTIF
jgi:hypothetical protein